MGSRNDPCSMESALACTASATSRASPVWTASGRTCALGFLRDGIKEAGIQTIEDAAGGAGFQNGFDAVDAIGLQSVDLLAGFFGSLRDAIELFQEVLARDLGYLIEDFRTVSTCRRKQGSAGPQVSSQAFAAGDRGSNVQHRIQDIAGAADGGYATIEVSLEAVQQHLVRVVVFVVAQDPAWPAEVDVDVDEARENGFCRRLP